MCRSPYSRHSITLLASCVFDSSNTCIRCSFRKNRTPQLTPRFCIYSQVYPRGDTKLSYSNLIAFYTNLVEQFNLSYHALTLWFSRSQRLLNHLDFKYFGLERILWMLFQKRVVRSNIDIYVFIDDGIK